MYTNPIEETRSRQGPITCHPVYILLCQTNLASHLHRQRPA